MYLPPPLLEIIDGEEEWVVEEILDSRMINQKLRYLVKWDGFRIEHNSWEPWDNIHAPDLISEFHRKHPGAPRLIQLIDFNAIAFQSIPSSVVLGHHSLEGGCQGTLFETVFPKQPYSVTYSVTHSVRHMFQYTLHSPTL